MFRQKYLYSGGVVFMLLLVTFVLAAAIAGARAETAVPAQIILVPVGSHDTPGQALRVALSGDYAYVADGPAGLRVLDVSVPSAPIEVAAWQTTLQDARDVVVIGDTAYVADGPGGLQLIDVSDPQHPAGAGWYPTVAEAQNVAVAGQYAYVTSRFSPFLELFDLNLPAGSQAVGSYAPVQSTWGQNLWGVSVAGEYAYVTVAEPGGTPGSGTRCGYHSECSYLEVVNVSDATSSVREGYSRLGSAIMSLPSSSSLVAIAKAGQHVYAADGSHSLVVTDVISPTAPVKVGQYSGVDPFAVHVVEPYLYLAAGDEGLYVLNIADPTTPSWAGYYHTPGNASGVVVDGSTVYVAAGDEGLVILGLTPATDHLYFPIIRHSP